MGGGCLVGPIRRGKSNGAIYFPTAPLVVLICCKPFPMFGIFKSLFHVATKAPPPRITIRASFAAEGGGKGIYLLNETNQLMPSVFRRLHGCVVIFQSVLRFSDLRSSYSYPSTNNHKRQSTLPLSVIAGIASFADTVHDYDIMRRC